MLNQALYDALTVVFRERPKVVNEGERANIVFPPPRISFIQDAETFIDNSNISGGEEYVVNCNFCKDSRHRLYFKYLWNTELTVGGTRYRCSDTLVHCFNENCQKYESNRRQWKDWVEDALKRDNSVEVQSIAASADTEQDLNLLKNHVPLPGNLMDIDSPNLPPYVRSYWLGTDKSKGERGFTERHLRDFGVRFAYLPYPIKLGAPVCRQAVTILPVVQNGDHWFFQIRLIPIDGDIRLGYERDQFGVELPKYIIPKGSKKNWALYNIDNARYYNTVYVVEGITDVMRIGPSAVARFGKTMSHAQMTIANRLLTGKNIVLVPDMDDPEALEQAIKQKVLMENSGNFRKVTLIKLPGNADPGSLEGGYAEVCQYLKELTDLQELNTQSLCGSLEIR